jgi:DNA polymerase (family 10)
MENKQIADFFGKIADLLEIQGENPFRIRSYRNAARILSDMPDSVEEMVKTGRDLEEIAGIGSGISKKIVEIVQTGKLKFLEEQMTKVPSGLPDLLKVEGLGPKKVKLFYDELGVDSLDTLEQAAKNGKLRELEGMGAKSEEKILKAIQNVRRGLGRFKLSVGLSYAQALEEYLKGVKGVKRLEPSGSLRRRCETVGDLDILAICDKNSPVMDAFTSYDDVEEVIAKGETKSSVRLGCGMQVDVRVLEAGSFGSGLQYFTGSKAHNIALRSRANDRGLKLSEYGVFEISSGKKVAGREEKDVYKALGLPLIPPELREDRGEVGAAEKGKLPKLIELSDMRGDLQMHTKESDGKNTIGEMVGAGKKLGYEYIAITEHSKAVRIANGLDEKRLAAQLKEIDKINAKLSGFRVLKGVEVDILGDGSLDLSDDILKECEVVIASVHSRFGMEEKEMTERIIRALENPHVNFLGHPTGRLILEREAYKVDLKEVIRAAVENNVCVEINAYPDRLDLRDVDARMAKEMGARISISTDAHATVQLELMKYGVFTARRAWLEPKDVVNTLPLRALLKTTGKGG